MGNKLYRGTNLRYVHLLLLCQLNMIKFGVIWYCFFSITVNTINKVIDHRSSLHVLLVSLLNWITLPQIKNPSQYIHLPSLNKYNMALTPTFWSSSSFAITRSCKAISTSISMDFGKSMVAIPPYTNSDTGTLVFLTFFFGVSTYGHKQCKFLGENKTCRKIKISITNMFFFDRETTK